MVDGTHLLFISSPSGYELREQHGEPPAVGAVVEVDGVRMRVSKVAPSPMPNDSRTCAYLQGI